MNKPSLLTYLTFMLLLLSYPVFTSVKGNSTSFAIDPSFKEVTIGSSFTLDLNVSDVTDLYLWVATVEWDHSIIEFQSYEEGPFLKAGGSTAIMDAGVSSGKVDKLVCTVLGPVSGVSGEGSLVTFTFNAMALGTTPVSITFSDLLNSNGDHISHDTYDGVVQVVPPNNPPSAPVVDVTPNFPYTTNELTCTVTTPSTDLDGDPITYTYEWFKDGSLEQTTVTTGLTDTLSSTLTSKGETWKCEVTPNDGKDDGPSGEDQVTIQNTPPVASNLSINPSSPDTTDDLVANHIYYDADGDADSGTQIRWYKDDALQSAYNDQLTVPSSATSENEEWYFTVRPKDGTDFGSLVQSNKVTIQSLPKHSLTVQSSPSGVTFTVDSVSHTTPWSDTYDKGTSVDLEMPETHTVGDAKYYWSQWSDAVTSRSRTVTMDTDITLTGEFTGPYYEITVTSSPVTGIPFTINGISHTTPYTEWFAEGFYTLEMPETHNDYVWSHWLEDGDTNRIKTIHLQGTTWTGVYVSAGPPSPPVGGEWISIDKLKLLAPWITLASLITVTTMSLLYVRHKKKKQN